MAYYPCILVLFVSLLASAGKWQAAASLSVESTVALPELAPPTFPEPEDALAPESFEVLEVSVPAFPLDAPFVVFLRSSNTNRYLCGGALVGRRAVLTAASCVLGRPLPQVVVGSIDNTRTTGPDVQVIGASGVVFHPSYLQNGSPNLAIVKLNSDAKEEPVKVPTRRFKLSEGSYLDMYGWGRLTSSSGNAETLQNIAVPYVPNNKCIFSLRRIIQEHEICMGGEGSGSCDGADGGAILHFDRLVGIIGGSHVCGRSSQLDVHINIVPYAKWIKTISRS